MLATLVNDRLNRHFGRLWRTRTFGLRGRVLGALTHQIFQFLRRAHQAGQLTQFVHRDIALGESFVQMRQRQQCPQQQAHIVDR